MKDTTMDGHAVAAWCGAGGHACKKKGDSEQEEGGTFPVYNPALKGGLGCVMFGKRKIALGAQRQCRLERILGQF